MSASQLVFDEAVQSIANFANVVFVLADFVVVSDVFLKVFLDHAEEGGGFGSFAGRAHFAAQPVQR